MGYAIVDPDDVDPLPDRPSEARPICGVASDDHPFEQLGIRMYVAEPGEQLPTIYHYNEVQEEAFYVISGTLSVETPKQVFEVDAGCLFLVDAGHPHRAFNSDDTAEDVRVLAMGAPTDDRGIPYEPE